MYDALRQLVRMRSQNRCEYCHLAESDVEYPAFHVEHVIAKQHEGDDSAENLCLACPECNRNKGPNLSGWIDGTIVPLFNPRKQSWKRHFRWEGAILVGITKSGRATIAVLAINSNRRINLRQQLLDEGLLQTFAK